MGNRSSRRASKAQSTANNNTNNNNNNNNNNDLNLASTQTGSHSPSFRSTSYSVRRRSNSKQNKARTRENSINYNPNFNSNDLQKCLEEVQQERKELEQLAKVTHFSEDMIVKLQDLFTFISSTNVDDMKIDIGEFARALGLRDDCIILKVLFEKFNVTKTKAMNFREFVMALSVLSPDATFAEKIRFSFQLYDINRDGKIDASELKKLLAAALNDTGSEIKLSDSDMDAICENTLRKVDLDGNGVIEFEEYKAMVEQNPRLIQPFTINIKELLDNYWAKTQQQQQPQPQQDAGSDDSAEDDVRSNIRRGSAEMDGVPSPRSHHRSKSQNHIPPKPQKRHIKPQSPPIKSEKTNEFHIRPACISCGFKQPPIKAVPINDVENLF